MAPQQYTPPLNLLLKVMPFELIKYSCTVMLGLKGSLALGKTLATALSCVQVRSVANPRALLTLVLGSLVLRLLLVLIESAVGQGEADLLTC